MSTPLMRGMRGGGDNREDCVHAFNERGAGRWGIIERIVSTPLMRGMRGGRDNRLEIIGMEV